MWKLPLLSIALAVSLLYAAARIGMRYIAFFGFPDGAAAELDWAEKGLAIAFVDISLVMTLWLFGLAALGFRRPIGKLLIGTSVVFLLCVAVILGLDLWFRSYMMDSAGG